MEANDAALVTALPPSVSSWLTANEITKLVFGEDGQFEDAVLLGYNLEIEASADVDVAAMMLNEAMVPAKRNDNLKALALLWEMTSHAESVSHDHLMLKFSGYAQKLMAYPADVALEAIEKWRGQWWPAWSQLEDECAHLVSWRRRTRDALARAAQATTVERKDEQQ